MIVPFLVVAVVLICFTGVLLFGAPYLPTLRRQTEVSLKLADLKAGDRLLELGCGDGRMVLAAARRGIKVVGYELNPILAFIAWLRTFRYRSNVRIIWGDFWRKDWPEAEAVFVFLLPKYMSKLDKKLVRYPHKPLKLVSFAFTIPDRAIDTEERGVYLYRYM